MPKSVKELREEIAEQKARLTALSELAKQEDRDFTDEELTEIDAIQGVGQSEGKIQKLESSLARAQKLEEMTIKELQNRGFGGAQDNQPRIKVKSIAGKLKAFSGPDAEHNAWVAGHFLRATIKRDEDSRQWLENHGIRISNAHSTGDNSKGGYLVPDETANTIIRLVEEFGVFRQNVGTVFPLPFGSLRVPKRNGGVTVYHPGENDSITASDLSFSMVELFAKKAAAMTVISSELQENALPILADHLVTEFAYGFAYDEDNAGFNGDGTQAFNRIVGLKNALAAGAIAQAGSGQTSFGALTLASFHNVIAKTKRYPNAQNRWYINSAGYAASMERLKAAGGGNSMMDLAEGSDAMFLGYPVVFSQALPSELGTNSSAKVAYFGDLSLACAMGDARSIEIASSTDRYFENDQIAVKATQRYDIQVHDRGTASEGGSITCLQLA